MNTHLSNNVIPLFDSRYHDHNWEPIDGWRARYRCKCGAIGRKPGLCVHRFEWEPYRTVEITPYVCTKKLGGVQCGCLAVKENRRGRWRCRAHLFRKPAKYANAARVIPLPARAKDAPLTPLREGEERLVRRSSAEP